MPKTIAVEDIANIRILVGGKAISPSRIQMRDGTLTIAMQKSSLAQLGQERPWYGVDGFQSLIYALVDTGIERPLILSRYLATSRDSVAVTMKYMADAGDLIRIRKGHYVTAERDAKGMTDKFWMQVLDGIYRQYRYL